MTRPPVLKALIAGVILGFVVMGVGGFLAAIAWPPWIAEFSRGHSRTASFISDTALYVLPIGMLAFLFGMGLFGWLKPARTSLLIACIAGYLGIGLLADMLTIFVDSDEPLAVWASIWSESGTWYRVATVPVALAFARVVSLGRFRSHH
jgi:peptidoglycan/LPS O-acetylase OafA/YrhL